MFSNLIDLEELTRTPTNSSDHFIFVGSLDKRKGFGVFFELIKKTPFCSYAIVGQPRDKTGHLYYEQLKSFSNVILFGRLSHAETMSQIANSKALISTSPMEGFPNIFIEAWACGKPVLSLYCDPGSVIEKERLGEIGHGTLGKIIEAMKVLKNSSEFAQKAKAYVDMNHVINTDKVGQINQGINELFKSKKIK